MRRSSDYNFRRLVEFQALNAVAIALGANWVITDMILLRMNFDLSRFGSRVLGGGGAAAEAEPRPSGLPLVLFCPGGSAAGHAGRRFAH